jgi:NRPS condensation-like uncharacterized protein
MQFHRRLGATEHAIWLRDRVTPLHFVLTAQVQGTIKPEDLRNALDRLQKYHPLLRVKIALQQNGTPYFVEQSTPIPCRILPRLGDAHWQAEAVWELSQSFDWEKAPLIRVVVLSSPEISELMVICHHAIADGKATINLIQEILTLLAHPDTEVSSRSIPPSLESLLPNYKPVSRIQKLLASIVLKMQQFRQCMNSELPVNSALQVDAGYLSSETTTQLIQRCRQAGTTVHAAICTAWLFAIASYDHSSEQTLYCFSPVNLRPYLMSQLEQECGLYITPVRTSHTISPQTQFWQIARSLQSSLKTQIAENLLLKQVQRHEALVATKPSPEFIHQIFNENCTSDVMVTNLGRLAIPQHYGSLFLKAIYGRMALT